MDEVSGTLCVSLIFTREEDVDFRQTFPIYTKIEVLIIAISWSGIPLPKSGLDHLCDLGSLA